MNDDKRMYFIRNIEALRDEDVDYHVTEYEIIANANIIGEFSYGPYYFTIWEFSLKYKGEKRKLCLRVRERAFPSVYQPGEPTKNGFYHGGSIAEELVYLASLFLRRKFELGPIVRMDDSPKLISKSQRRLDKHLVAGESNLKELTDWFKLVEGLVTEYHQRFILAARLYHRAIMLIEEQPDMAYLDLVSAIETLCRDYDIGDLTLSNLSNRELERLVGSVKDEDLRSKIEEAIVKSVPFIRRRFVEFIVDHTEDDFWTEKNRPELGKIKREDFAGLLRRIYDQRSSTLHNGEPFPPSVFSPPISGAEIVPALSISKGERRWKPKDFIPYLHFFEKLVNHVLKNFLKRNQV